MGRILDCGVLVLIEMYLLGHSLDVIDAREHLEKPTFGIDQLILLIGYKTHGDWDFVYDLGESRKRKRKKAHNVSSMRTSPRSGI